MTVELLAPLRDAPSQSAVILDVDGTLAPIAARPELARVPEETRAELERLTAAYRLVACVSGRAGSAAERLVGVPGIRYVGNHGLELHPDAQRLTAQVASFRDSIDQGAEDKGLTLSYHYREAGDERAARRELEEIAARAQAEGLIPRWGRKVLEIRPAVEADKGTAVRALLADAGATRALYAGDDTTDLDAFRGLAEAGLEHYVRVAVISDEAPPELAENADLTVNSTDELIRLLASL
jgi:trehalose 6-phosphate phosphatase